MSNNLSRDPRVSSYWCYCCNSISEREDYTFTHQMTVVREIHTLHSWTDYENVHEQHHNKMPYVNWSKQFNCPHDLGGEWEPIPREVFEEVKRQFLENMLLRNMKPFQETETVLRSENGKLFYKPVNQ